MTPGETRPPGINNNTSLQDTGTGSGAGRAKTISMRLWRMIDRKKKVLHELSFVKIHIRVMKLTWSNFDPPHVPYLPKQFSCAIGSTHCHNVAAVLQSKQLLWLGHC